MENYLFSMHLFLTLQKLPKNALSDFCSHLTFYSDNMPHEENNILRPWHGLPSLFLPLCNQVLTRCLKRPQRASILGSKFALLEESLNFDLTFDLRGHQDGPQKLLLTLWAYPIRLDFMLDLSLLQ